MASDFLLVVDDNSGDFSFSGDWSVNSLVQWYGGTSRQLREGTSATQSESFSMIFEGTSVSFFGVTPFPTNVSVSIDGAAPSTSTYGDPNPPSYRQWYQSPQLADGRHTITVSDLAGVSLDYAIVRSSNSTSLSGKRLIVDDDNPTIQYNGNWVRNSDGFQAGNIPGGSPFHNGTHQSWTVGDKISYKFLGSSVAVYGIFSWAQLGLLSATYTLDGTPLSETYSVTTSSPEYLNNVGEAPNFLFYSTDRISSGEHTLVIELTHCTNQSFILDYITYSPSFDSISRAPFQSISSSSSKPSPTGGGKADTIYNPKTSSTPEIDSTGKKMSPEAIVGTVAGGLVFLALVGILIFYVRGRRTRRGHKKWASDDYKRPLISEKLSPVQRDFMYRLSYRSPKYTITPYTQSLPNTTAQTAQQQTFPQTERPHQREPAAQTRPLLPPILTDRTSRPGLGPSTSSLIQPPGTSVANVFQPERRLTPLRREFVAAPPGAGRATAQVSRPIPGVPVGGRPATHGTARPGLQQNSLARIQVQENHNISANNSLGRATTLPCGNGPSSMIPIRRGFSDSPSLFEGPTAPQTQHMYQVSVTEISHSDCQWDGSTQESSMEQRPLMPARTRPADDTPPSTGTSYSQRSRSPPSVDAAPQSAHARLTPVRRTFVCEPPVSAPAALNRTPSSPSPLANLFPRLTSIWRRGSRDVPQDVGEDEDDIAPPAYHTLSARQSSALSPHAARPLPARPL